MASRERPSPVVLRRRPIALVLGGGGSRVSREI